jgi:ATP-dependent Clp protease adapter protein ClpS
MHAAKVVMRDVQRDGCAVVQVGLAETVCQPRRAALRHAQRQILALDV